MKRVEIEGFRNLKPVAMEPSRGFNLIIGKNAQGKSNLLEALYSLSIGKSYRTTRESDVISFLGDWARAMGICQTLPGDLSIEILWQAGEDGLKKRIKINGNPSRNLKEFWGKTKMVIFSPLDLEIISGPPGFRRRFLDLLLSKLDPSYLFAFQQYQQVIEQRNHWLREEKRMDESLGGVLTDQAAEWGAEIIRKRIGIINRTISLISEYFRKISGEDRRIKLKYISLTEVQKLMEFEPEPPKEQIREALLRGFARKASLERERKRTLAGPHIDEILFLKGGKSERDFASMGELRTLAAILRLIEIDLLRGQWGVEPILLMDDCFSEFDKGREENFWRLIGEQNQVFYASTQMPDFAGSAEEIRIFQINEGEVTEDASSR